MKSTSAPGPAAGRPHVERQLVGVALGGQAHDVGAARQVLRHREVEVGGPSRIVEDRRRGSGWPRTRAGRAASTSRRPVQRAPVTARVGRFTSRPPRRCGPTSTTSRRSMPREKSQPARSPAGGSRGSSAIDSGAAAAAASSSGSSSLPFQCSRASRGQARAEQDRCAARRAGPRAAAAPGSRGRSPPASGIWPTRSDPRRRVDHHPDPLPRAQRDGPAARKRERRRAGHADARGDAGGADRERPSRAGALVPAGDHALLARRPRASARSARPR